MKSKIFDDEITQKHLDWCQQMFRILEEGGHWALPRSGVVLQKQGNKLVFIGEMYEQDRKKIASTPNDIKHRFKKRSRLKVRNDRILTADQRYEFLQLREVYKLLNIEVENDTGEMPYLQGEHGTYTWGITKAVGPRVIQQQLGVSFYQEEAIRDLVRQGFDLSSMTVLHGTRPASPRQGFA